jgi:hypothetical protein
VEANFEVSAACFGQHFRFKVLVVASYGGNYTVLMYSLLLRFGSASVRLNAVLRLATSLNSEASNLLLHRLKIEPDELICSAILRALRDRNFLLTVDQFSELLTDLRIAGDIRAQIVESFCPGNHTVTITALRRELENKDERLVRAAGKALQRINTSEAFGQLADGIEKISNRNTVRFLAEVLRDSNLMPTTRRARVRYRFALKYYDAAIREDPTVILELIVELKEYISAIKKGIVGTGDRKERITELVVPIAKMGTLARPEFGSFVRSIEDQLALDDVCHAIAQVQDPCWFELISGIVKDGRIAFSLDFANVDPERFVIQFLSQLYRPEAEKWGPKFDTAKNLNASVHSAAHNVYETLRRYGSRVSSPLLNILARKEDLESNERDRGWVFEDAQGDLAQPYFSDRPWTIISLAAIRHIATDELAKRPHREDVGE